MRGDKFSNTNKMKMFFSNLRAIKHLLKIKAGYLAILDSARCSMYNRMKQKFQ